MPRATFEKNSIKKRGDESIVRKMQTLMSSRPCGTLLNILSILGSGVRGEGEENSFSQLNQRRESLSSLKIL